MTYEAIILQAGGDARARRRLDVAVTLAERFDAALIGLGAETFPTAYSSPEAAFIEGPLLVEHRARVERTLDDARATFEESAAARVKGAEWRAVIDFPTKALVREARAADLVLASSDEPADPYRHVSAADLVMNAGRPILLLPAAVRRFEGRSVTIGWKDTREARRAVADALPFLKMADHVAVVEICKEAEREAALARTSDVARALGRHGVHAHAHARLPTDLGPASDLSQVAREHEADLLVVGGYGHSRLREWIFGGVTRSLLGHADRYVLMSH